MKSEKVKALRESLIEKIGIDFERYKSDELSDRIGGLITFPVYFWSIILKPLIVYLLIVLALSIILLLLGDSVIIAILSLIIGIILFIFNGVLQGLVNFLKRLEEDISAISNLCLEITHSVLGDIKNAGSKRTKELPKIGEIISGVMLIVIVPTLNRIIRDKIPFMGGPVVGLIDLSLDKLTAKLPNIADNISESNIVKRTEDKKDQISGVVDGTLSKYYEVSSSILDKVAGSTGNTVKIVFKSVALPFRIVLNIGYLITIIIYFVLCQAAF